MRLDKFIAHASGYSRSDVKRLLRAGRIRVNDVICKDPAHILLSLHGVVLDDKPLILDSEHRYYMLNKPAGVVSATEDGEHRTVLDLIPYPQRIDLQVAGRLDLDTTGLVLLTTDGQWSHRLRKPGGGFKRYRVLLAERLSDTMCEQLCAGVLLAGEEKPTLPARCERLGEREMLLSIAEGRYHQVKRMCAAVGNHVMGLHREAVASIELDPLLVPGAWRPLTKEEITSIC